ncbi:ATP-dependent helicase/deoxyribonuclease subunit B [Bienertia sinuspersici]
MPKRSDRALPLLPFNLELERTVRAIQRERRAIASDHSSSESSGTNTPLDSLESSVLDSFATPFEMENNRTLREFGAPPPYEDVSGIATPAIEANNYEFKDNLKTLIEGHQFSGASLENPRNHLKQFLRYCNTVKANGVSQEYIRMSLFKFSLTRKALDWLDRLPLNSLTTWDEVTIALLSKFIPLEKTVELRLRISTFQQEENESLFEAWERFKNLLNDFPYHGMDKWLLLHSFYRGLSGQNKMCLDAASSKPIMKKDPVEAIRIIEVPCKTMPIGVKVREPPLREVGGMMLVLLTCLVLNFMHSHLS